MRSGNTSLTGISGLMGMFPLSEEVRPLLIVFDRGRCPPGEKYPGESPQQMSDRVDRVIAKIRAIHKEVRIPK